MPVRCRQFHYQFRPAPQSGKGDLYVVEIRLPRANTWSPASIVNKSAIPNSRCDSNRWNRTQQANNCGACCDIKKGIEWCLQLVLHVRTTMIKHRPHRTRSASVALVAVLKMKSLLSISSLLLLSIHDFDIFLGELLPSPSH